MRRTLVALSACLIALAGCDARAELEEFGYQQQDPGTVAEPSVDVAGFSSEVLFVGQLIAPNGCYELVPNFSRSGNTLKVDISVRVRQAGCAATPTGYVYSGAIRNVEPNTYNVQITHAFRNNELPTEVFTRSVVVR